MRQRVMIAMALVNSPSLLIADEPTTALDVTIQAQILDLIRDLQGEARMATIMITHDLGVVAEIATDVAVMYAGQIVEQGPVAEIFANPQHPYTIGLMSSVPKLSGAARTAGDSAGDGALGRDDAAGLPFLLALSLRRRDLRDASAAGADRAGPPRRLPLRAARDAC